MPRVLNQTPRIGSLTVRSYRRPTSPAYSCGPGVLTQSSASGRVPHRSFSTQAYVTRVQCRPGVWNQPATSGRFPDCSYPSQVLQAPRTRGVTASGRSLVALLTVPFPPRPTSPAYSPTSPACALRCRKPLFFAVCTCRRFESHVLFHTDSPTCVFPCPRALYDAMASPEASRRTAAAAACPRRPFVR